MTEREKLREVINQWLNDPIPFDETFDYGTMLTDYLISKGVTIPVRCGECRYHEQHTQNNYYCGRAEEFSEIITNWVEPNDFCSYGERKEDDR